MFKHVDCRQSPGYWTYLCNLTTWSMFAKCWLIVKDDTKRTFEVCGQDGSGNAFYNSIHAMQKAGMNVSSMLPPVTNKTASKDLIKVTNFTPEPGLYARLQKEFREIAFGNIEDY